jgi:MATE family multidrug resistance protein
LKISSISNFKAEFIKPHSIVLKIAAPIIIANISVPLLGFVDTAVMGHQPHAYYLGAVAVGATIMQFIFWIFGFLRMGTTGLTAQAYGAGEIKEIQLNFQRALLLAFIISFLLWFLKDHVIDIALYFFKASDDVESLARNYFNIRIWSAPATLINYCLIGWFIGIQRTHSILILQVWMNLVNIILDLIFVISFEWGVEGVALATVIAELTTVALGFCFYLRRVKQDKFIFDFRNIADLKKLQYMLTINLNIFIRTFCLIFAFCYFTAQAAKYGDSILAANAILLQFIHFLSFGLDGFAQAAEALVGNALGKKSILKFRIAVKTTVTLAVSVSLIYTLFYLILGSSIITLFTSNASIRLIANNNLIWVILLPMIAVWPYMLDGIFIGATRSADMRNGMVLSLIIFILSIMFLQPTFGYYGLWIGILIFMSARGATLAFAYNKIEQELKEVTVTDAN